MNNTWKAFYIRDLFAFQKGNQNNMSRTYTGRVPLVSAKKSDNGYKGFIAPNGKTLFRGEILTLNNDGDGGAGISYYQPCSFALDTHVTALIPLFISNRYILLFIASCITRQKSKFGHGYSLNNSRLNALKIMLPISDDGSPDWQFMENFMRAKEQKLLDITLKTLKQRLLQTNYRRGGVTHYVKFKDFVFGELFSIKATASGIDKINLNGRKGHVPYLTRSNIDNAISDFIGEQNADLGSKDEGNVITIGLDTQTVFYQPKAFYTGQNIQIIRHDRLNRYNAIFIIVAIRQLVNKFNWGSYGATLTRLRRGKLFLPIDKNGEPDWAYMETLAKETETRLILKYLKSKENSM